MAKQTRLLRAITYAKRLGKRMANDPKLLRDPDDVRCAIDWHEGGDLTYRELNIATDAALKTLEKLTS
jgi:hypothetical protein